jgi:ABC-type branched-subunit amino acid transport system ATPase component
VGGALLGALWVFGLPALFGFSDAVELLTANLGLLILLLYFPGGLIGVVYNVRDLFLRWYADKRGLVPDWSSVKRVDAVPTRRPDRNLPMGEEPWLRTHDVSVTFGGIRAVSEVSLEVHRGEIVGLIGTNGAGKSTLMNAISGFVPNTGTIEVLGVDVSHLPAHKRHAVGLGRGFQDAVLFPGLTVRETVLVALEARERSLLVPSMFALPPSPGAEKRKGREAEDILAFLGLLPFADNQVVDLSTGTRRIVELACLLATEAKVLLLDEPTGGVAQKETEAFAPLIKRVQRELDAAIVVIEHDMPLIMSISDRVYCLEAGAVISSGSPDNVRNDPAVIASYLGTDERAIVRSNQPAGG